MYKMLAISLLLIVFAPSLMLTETSFAFVPMPSVPEFKIKVIDLSYEIPATTLIDPYNGQIVNNPAEHIDNRTLQFMVENQPFNMYYDSNSGFNITLFFNIRMKGHYTNNWTVLFPVDSNHPIQSTSEYTEISLPLGENSETALRWLPTGSSQVDFQVEAMIGYFSRTTGIDSWYFTGEESGWSNTQTLTIDASAPTATPNTSTLPSENPTSTSDQPNDGTSVLFSLGLVEVAIVTLLAVIAVLLVFVVLVLYLRRRAVK